MHRTSAEYMHVEMIDGLATVSSRADHYPKSIGEPLHPRDFSRGPQQVPQQRFVFFLRFCHRRDVLARNHQHMYRRLRIDVMERDAMFVLVGGLRRHSAFDNSAKKASHIGSV